MKKNFKKVVLAVAFCAMASVVSAQGFYGKVGVGYGFGAGKASWELSEVNETENGDRTIKDVPVSLGQGVTTALGVGYMFNKYIGVELSAGYLIGTNITAEGKDVTPGFESEYTEKLKYSGLSLTPAIVLSVPASEKLSVYSRFGITLPLFGTAVWSTNETFTTAGTTNTEEREIELTSYFGLGGAAAIGVSYNLTEKLSLFGELNGSIGSFQAKKGTLTKSTRNGVDQLPDMDTKDKEVEYKKEYNTADDNGDDNQPDQAVSFRIPTSSIGLMIGLSFKF